MPREIGQPIQPNWDVLINGMPKHVYQYNEGILKEARRLAQEPYQSYGGLTPEQRKERDEKIKEARNFPIPENAKIPISIPGLSKPVLLTPEELYLARSNKNIAAQIYTSALGGIRPLKKDIEKFQNEISKNYPDMIEEGRHLLENSHQKIYENVQNESEAKNAEEYENLIAPYIKLQEKAKLLKSQKPKNINNFSKESQEYKNLMSPYKEQRKSIYDLLNPDKFEKQSEKLIESQTKRDLENFKNIQKQYLNKTGESLNKRAGVEHEVKKLMTNNVSRIAPMNEMHAKANRMLEHGFDDDTLDIARKEIDASKNENISRSIQPFIKEAMQGPDQYVDKYRNRYQKNVIQALKDETQENFLENVAPHINMSFTQRGAFHSGARNSALEKAAKAKERNLHREIAKLMSQGEDKAMQYAAEHHKNALSSAEITGNATKAQQEGSRANADLLRQNALSKQALNHTNFTALNQVAHAEQKQKQNEIDTKLAQHYEEQERAWKQLEKENAITRGLPFPQQSFSAQALGQPVPPNPYNAMGGALGAMYGLNRAREAPFAKGGSVRAKYAQGGAVARWNELEEAVKPGPHDQDIRMIAQEMRNHRVDPVANWMGHVGNAMLSNSHGNPMQNLGKGSTNASEAMERHQAQALESKMRAANLYDKINDSRMNQHKILAAYETQQQQLAETQRQHQASLAQQHAHHLQNLEVKQAKYGADGTEISKKVTPTDRKTIIEARKGLRSALGMEKKLKELEILGKETTTGPVVGWMKENLLPATKIDNIRRVITNKLVLDMHQGMKNIPRGKDFMERIDSTKLSLKNHPEANEEALNMMREGAEEIKLNSIHNLLDQGWTPQRIEKEFKIKLPSEFYEENEEHSPETSELPEQSINNNPAASLSTEELMRIAQG